MEYPSLDTAKAGAFRYNTDSNHLEIYDGNQWTEIVGDSPHLHTGGTRGVWAGGEEPGGRVNRIQYQNLASGGDTLDFGDASRTLTSHKAVANSTRGLIAGGFDGGQPTNYNNTIDLITIASTGNATDYGDLAVFTGGQRAACSNEIRGLIMGGMYAGVHNNTIEVAFIPQNGNTVDFGNLTSINVGPSGVASQTRALCFFGNTTPARSNGIDYVTISTQGNASDFGDSTSVGNHRGTAANAVRAVTAGGQTDSGPQDVIQYVTIATLGDATDFGDLRSGNHAGYGGGAASRTRGVFGGGYNPSTTNDIDMVEIMSLGNSIDFGNMAATTQYAAGMSNGHGGL